MLRKPKINVNIARYNLYSHFIRPPLKGEQNFVCFFLFIPPPSAFLFEVADMPTAMETASSTNAPQKDRKFHQVFKYCKLISDSYSDPLGTLPPPPSVCPDETP